MNAALRLFPVGLWALLAGGSALLGANAAMAQTCTTKADCPDGFICKSYGTVCTDIACPDGMACPKSVSDCQDVLECVPPDCTEDSECPKGMVCEAYQESDCPPFTEIDCPPGADCPKQSAEPAPCTEVTKHACTARYRVACKADADCGDGFKCIEGETCECSGSSGSGSSPTPSMIQPMRPIPPAPPADGGMAMGDEPNPPPAEPDCPCAPSGTFYCELQEAPCTDASDCPDDFTCESNPNTAVCASTEPAQAPGTAGAGSSNGPQDAGAAPAPDPAIDPCGVDASAPKNVCLPPYWNIGGGRGAAEAGLAKGAPGTLADGNSNKGAPTAASGNDVSGMNPSDSSESKASDACSVSAPGARGGSALQWFGLLGLVGLLRRRRHAA